MNLTEPLPQALLLATLAGASIPLGAWLATFERLLPRWLEAELKHSISAFGGGALLAAVALVLVPHGAERLAGPAAIIWFAAGGLTFFAADRALARSGGAAAQFMAMMLDYIPEAMALGALLAGEAGSALLIAGLIALQNLPEGFNAFRELREGGAAHASDRRLLTVFALMVPLGPLAAASGHLWLSQHEAALGAIMLFASGGILYLLFEDVAPQSRLENHWAPPLGAVAGFALGLAGHLVIAG